MTPEELDALPAGSALLDTVYKSIGVIKANGLTGFGRVEMVYGTAIDRRNLVFLAPHSHFRHEWGVECEYDSRNSETYQVADESAGRAAVALSPTDCDLRRRLVTDWEEVR